MSAKDAENGLTPRDCGKNLDRSAGPEGGRGVQRRGQGPLRREDVGGGADPHRGREAVGAPLAPLAGPVAARRARGQARGQGPQAAARLRAPQARALPGGDARGGAQAPGPRQADAPDSQDARPEGRRGRLRVGPEGAPARRGRYDGGGGGRRGEGDGRRGGRAREAEGRGRGAQGDAQRPKSRRPGETLEQAEGRVGREVARGLRVPPRPRADLLGDIEELLRVREARSGEGAGGAG